MKIASFSDCFKNLSLIFRTASVTSSEGISSKQDRGEKEIRNTADCVFGVLSNELAAGVLDLMPIHLPMAALSGVCACVICRCRRCKLRTRL